jgi:hypothetical protein
MQRHLIIGLVLTFVLSGGIALWVSLAMPDREEELELQLTSMRGNFESFHLSPFDEGRRQNLHGDMSDVLKQCGLSQDRGISTLEAWSFGHELLSMQALATLHLLAPDRAAARVQLEIESASEDNRSRDWATRVAFVTFAEAESPAIIVERAQSFLRSSSPALRMSGHMLLTMLTMEARAPDPWPQERNEVPDIKSDIWSDDASARTPADDVRVRVAAVIYREAPRLLSSRAQFLVERFLPLEEYFALRDAHPDPESFAEALPPMGFAELQMLYSPLMLF